MRIDGISRYLWPAEPVIKWIYYSKASLKSQRVIVIRKALGFFPQFEIRSWTSVVDLRFLIRPERIDVEDSLSPLTAMPKLWREKWREASSVRDRRSCEPKERADLLQYSEQPAGDSAFLFKSEGALFTLLTILERPLEIIFLYKIICVIIYRIIPSTAIQ